MTKDELKVELEQSFPDQHITLDDLETYRISLAPKIKDETDTVVFETQNEDPKNEMVACPILAPALGPPSASGHEEATALNPIHRFPEAPYVNINGVLFTQIHTLREFSG